MEWIWILLIILFSGLFILRFIIIPYYSRRPANLGLKNGLFLSCPTTDNCVNSQEKEKIHQINPIIYTVDIETAKTRIKRAIQSYGRTKIITEKSDYIYTEFRSLLWGFVDDVEFFFDDANKLIHFRSASRVGTNDYGENRKRMERIRAFFTSEQN